MVIQFISAIGMLLFGISIASASFEKLCGNRLRKFIDRFSNNRTKACLFGTMITILFQSSTASVALIVGLASTGILSLLQSVALIIGSNIGSAISTIIVSFQSINIVEYFGLLTFIGVFIRLISKKSSSKNWGMCIAGLGLTFLSLSLMTSATQSFKSSAEFLNIFTTISNPFVLIIIGLVFTAIVNSSLGTMAVIASLIGSSAGGILTINSAAYIIYGMNIGTCLTGLIIGTSTTNKDSLRTSISHLIFNIVGTIIFSLFSIFDWITPLTGFLNNASLQLVFINVIFNVFTAILMLILLGPFCKLLKLIIRDKAITEESPNNDINSESTILAFIQLSTISNELFNQTTQVLCESMDYVQQSDSNYDDFVKYRDTCTAIIKSAEQMNENLFKINGGLSDGDLQNKKTLNDIFIGIKKTCKNIDKLLKSCMDEKLKVKYNQKQIKMISSLKSLVEENSQDMLIIFEQSQQKSVDADYNFLLSNIIERLEQILDIKVEAKKYVISSTINNSIEKYSSFLNVINYFEEINTNLTDITLSVLREVPNLLNNEQISIDKLE